MICEYDVYCPHCGETFIAIVDYSSGSHQYIEDCHVCCQPIVFDVRVDEFSGELDNVETYRE